LQTDQIIGGPDGGWVRNLHKNGLCALYSDLHAKFVQDDSKHTLMTDGTSGTGGAARLYNMWEYFGRHP
jgi:hypothetical protein